MIKAVIFDLDGTLIDTERFFKEAWPEAFEHFGYKMSFDEYLSIRSLGKPFIVPRLCEIADDKEFDYEKVRDFRSNMMEEKIKKNGIKAKKGARELLKFLKERKIICAIATASPVERSRRYLEMAGISTYFDKIISARSVKEGKPSPDVYDFAVKELGIKKDECLAVEDSPNGALSAFRAGLKVVFVPDLAPCDEETKKIIFGEKENLGGIIDLLK